MKLVITIGRKRGELNEESKDGGGESNEKNVENETAKNRHTNVLCADATWRSKEYELRGRQFKIFVELNIIICIKRGFFRVTVVIMIVVVHGDEGID